MNEPPQLSQSPTRCGVSGKQVNAGTKDASISGSESCGAILKDKDETNAFHDTVITDFICDDSWET